MIPNAPDTYDRSLWQQILTALGRALDGAFVKGQDVRLQRGERLILVDQATGALYAVTVQAGALVLQGPL